MSEGRRIALMGVLSIVSAPQLREVVVEAARACEVDFDCEALDDVDCSATQLLLALTREVRERGGRVSFHGVPEAVRAHWRRAGLAGVLLGETEAGADASPSVPAAGTA